MRKSGFGREPGLRAFASMTCAIHSLRSPLQAALAIYIIGKALGHSQAQTTERYAHLRDDALHAVAASVQRSVLRRRRGSPLPVVPRRRGNNARIRLI